MSGPPECGRTQRKEPMTKLQTIPEMELDLTSEEGSVALDRILRELKDDDSITRLGSYDRVHNRHNR